MTVPATAIYFTAYDQLKAFLCGRALTSDLYAPMVAGALARCEHSLGPLISLSDPHLRLSPVLASSSNVWQLRGRGISWAPRSWDRLPLGPVS